jgi:hypothetical protein
MKTGLKIFINDGNGGVESKMLFDSYHVILWEEAEFGLSFLSSPSPDSKSNTAALFRSKECLSGIDTCGTYDRLVPPQLYTGIQAP